MKIWTSLFFSSGWNTAQLKAYFFAPISLSLCMNSVIKEEKQKTTTYLVYDLGHTTRFSLLEQRWSYSVEKHTGHGYVAHFVSNTPLLAQLF